MAREILFKAKRTDNGEWIKGCLTIFENNAYIMEAENTYIRMHYTCEDCVEFDMRAYKVDKDTICQYTGLTDKNGNKIWENDIVKYHFGEEVAPIRFGEYQSCFDSAKTAHIGFYVDWNNNKALRKDLGYWVNMIDCNVIGNIFDNPELLGGADNG